MLNPIINTAFGAGGIDMNASSSDAGGTVGGSSSSNSSATGTGTIHKATITLGSSPINYINIKAIVDYTNGGSYDIYLDPTIHNGDYGYLELDREAYALYYKCDENNTTCLNNKKNIQVITYDDRIFDDLSTKLDNIKDTANITIQAYGRLTTVTNEMIDPFEITNTYQTGWQK